MTNKSETHLVEPSADPGFQVFAVEVARTESGCDVLANALPSGSVPVLVMAVLTLISPSMVNRT